MANLSQNKKYHYLYKTTNLVNGKYYYGMHSTNNLNDGYIGSGKYLWYAIKKYGAENFHAEILQFFDTRESLVEGEKNLITKLVVDDPKCMNLKSGGSGGFFSMEACTKGGRVLGQLHAERLKNDELYRAKVSELSKALVARRKEAGTMCSFPKGHSIWKGKKHAPDTIEKMKDAKKDWGKGETNSQHGTKWITNGVDNKKIRSTDQIPEGWVAGRKTKV